MNLAGGSGLMRQLAGSRKVRLYYSEDPTEMTLLNPIVNYTKDFSKSQIEQKVYIG
jgi:hypothetical protein